MQLLNEDESFHKIFETFEQSYCDQKRQNDSWDGVIQLEEYLKFYNYKSTSITFDESFSLMMNNS